MKTTPEHDARMAKMNIFQESQAKLVDELAKGKKMDKILRNA